MKEVIEYVLATLVILSCIPLYNFITDQLYSPPELEVDYSLATMFSEHVIDTLKQVAVYGNLSSPLIDLSTYIREKLSYLGNEYGYQISIVSQGILDTVIQGNTLMIYTMDQGNISILAIFSDGSMESMTITSPSTIYPNNTYVYETPIPNTSQLKFIIAVLDTGVYQYIDYYSNGTDIVYLGNINNTLYLISDHQFLPNSIINGSQCVMAEIISFSNGNFLVSKETKYKKYLRFEQEPIWLFYFIIWEIYESIEIRYYAIYDGVTTVGPYTYYKYKISVLEEKNTIKDPIYWLLPFWYDPPEPENITPPVYIMNELRAPIYNLLLVLLKDANGDIHIAIWYPHSIVVGDNVPKDLPVRRVVMLRRLGMIDYYVTIYVWRRSI